MTEEGVVRLGSRALSALVRGGVGGGRVLQLTRLLLTSACCSSMIVSIPLLLSSVLALDVLNEQILSVKEDSVS